MGVVLGSRTLKEGHAIQYRGLTATLTRGTMLDPCALGVHEPLIAAHLKVVPCSLVLRDSSQPCDSRPYIALV